MAVWEEILVASQGTVIVNDTTEKVVSLMQSLSLRTLYLQASR
jgi:hypothetical protein